MLTYRQLPHRLYYLLVDLLRPYDEMTVTTQPEQVIVTSSDEELLYIFACWSYMSAIPFSAWNTREKLIQAMRRVDCPGRIIWHGFDVLQYGQPDDLVPTTLEEEFFRPARLST